MDSGIQLNFFSRWTPAAMRRKIFKEKSCKSDVLSDYGDDKSKQAFRPTLTNNERYNLCRNGRKSNQYLIKSETVCLNL
jgi:hypothetical protein